MTKIKKMNMHQKQVQLDSAMAMLNGEVNRGVDFPEALYRATKATGVNYKLLSAAYDAQYATFH